ncbi:hypothetical protein MZE11_19435, partial [Bacillus amyloliquefaciens]|nr:hypothetical protein [Bacillus amyloliquefaciens]
MAGVDGDGDGPRRGHRQRQPRLVARGDVHEADVLRARVLGVVSALIVDPLVGVALLGVDAAVVLDVLEGVVHEPAVAAVVAVRGRAVDEVLLRQRNQEALLSEVLALQGTRRAEGPAGAA